MRALFLSLLLVTSNAMSDPSINGVFEAQTYSLFKRNHVSVVVTNGNVIRGHDGSLVYEADVQLTLLSDRPAIVDGITENIVTNFVTYKFPSGSFPSNYTENDKRQAREIISRGVADGIVMATLGSSNTRGSIVSRPRSKVTLFSENGRYFLNVLGSRVYVD